MDVIRAPAPAAAGASRSFPAELVMTTLFDCPLWPSTEMDPNVLVSFMTGVDRLSHPFPAHMLCRESLAQQFPKLLDDYGSLLQLTTLYQDLANQAESRSGELGEWLKEVAQFAQVDLNLGSESIEPLNAAADELDWLLHLQPDRLEATRLWFHRSTKSPLLKPLVTVAKSTLDASLPQLDALYRHREEQALHKHRMWLQTRRVVAELPAQVNVQPLPIGTYTELPAEHSNSELAKESFTMPFTWGRLEYFRLQAKQKPFD